DNRAPALQSESCHGCHLASHDPAGIVRVLPRNAIPGEPIMHRRTVLRACSKINESECTVEQALSFCFERQLCRRADALIGRRCLSGLAATLAAPAIARATTDHITFGLDWKAEAGYGGYYQAATTGIYAKHGLNVSVQQGGPEVNHTQLLLAGRLDFNICSNSFLALNFVKQNIPFRTVAAMFQKDLSVLIAHHGQGNDSFSALKGKPIMISGDTRVGWWNF
ncbi:MAG TPA: ABC transporter substrate-binding protein, partial [Acetobacteraceae bacterium]|nr:ABC transporter substrate-binding protein [Acetobacteraceae bacterium]